MTLFFHELKRDSIKLIVWTAVTAFMLCTSVLIYPQMTSQMAEMGDMFSEMGAFSTAFGMDKVNFGEFSGYFAVECGNVLGLGGAFFAAVTGILSIAKEEGGHTAEFLLTHPLSRTFVVAQKLASLIAQVVIFNIGVMLAACLSAVAIGESAEAKLLFDIFLGYLLMQVEIACVAFGASAFLKDNGIAIGLGGAFVLYFLNILANLTEEAKFLKYVTPFSYADATAIVSSGGVEIKYLLPGLIFTAIGVALAFIRYNRKDIRA